MVYENNTAIWQMLSYAMSHSTTALVKLSAPFLNSIV